MTHYFVGVDGGGTKTRAVAQSDTGVDVGESTTGPCTLAAMTAKEASTSITDAIHQLGIDFGSVIGLCAAVAGWSFVERRMELDAELLKAFPNAKISVVPDFMAGFRNAHPDRHGIHTVAGTGSVSYGEIENGLRTHRAGGYGYLIDDAGSAYGVGRESISAAMRSIDGSGPKTSLGEWIAQSLGLASDDWDSLISAVYGGTADRVTIAGLAQVVSNAASDGDEVARHILHKAGGALARLTEAVYRGLNDGRGVGTISSASMSFSRSGSLWHAGGYLSDIFERSVFRFCPGADIGNVSEVDAAKGALEIALNLS